MESIANKAFIQQGIVGPFCGRRETGGRDRVYGAGAADVFADGEGKLIPADPAFIAVVIDTGEENVAGQDMEDGGGEVGGIGGCADLVFDDIDRGSFGHQPDHGLYEVIAILRIYPGSADDDGAFGMLCKGLLLASEFGRPIDIDGTGSVGLFEWKIAISGEDIIRRNMDEAGAAFPAGGGKITRTVAVDAESGFLFRLGLIDGGIGCAIDDPRWLIVGENPGYLLWVIDGQLVTTGKEKFKCGVAGSEGLQFTA